MSDPLQEIRDLCAESAALLVKAKARMRQSVDADEVPHEAYLVWLSHIGHLDYGHSMLKFAMSEFYQGATR